MKSELLEMKNRHFEEIETLRKTCKHLPSYLKKKLNSSSVGAGSLYPAVEIICRNCGKSKIIFDLSPESRKRVKMQVNYQGGFKDERCNLYAQYDDDLK